MYRFILDKLLAWKISDDRKPLVLQGARQVGKTWALKEFGRCNYQNTAYFNFKDNKEYIELFKDIDNTDRIIQNLALTRGVKIDRNTLIIFDDIDNSLDVIKALKYFCLAKNSYHIACATTSLNIISDTNFANDDCLTLLPLYPMTFKEFLLATNASNLVRYLDDINTIDTIPAAFFNPLIEKLRMYFVSGGMPYPVMCWSQDKDVSSMQEALDQIIKTYDKDFLNTPYISDINKIIKIYKAMPSMLSKRNKKFMFKDVDKDARSHEYERALQYLINTKALYKVQRSKAPYNLVDEHDDNAFKLYLSDLGILRTLLGLTNRDFVSKDKLFSAFNGVLTESFVHQALIAQFDIAPRYWIYTNPPYEIEFLIKCNDDIYPVEVKVLNKKPSSSLKNFKKMYANSIKLAIRFSLDNLKLDGDVLNIPVFMADHTNKLIDIALKQNSELFQNLQEPIGSCSALTDHLPTRSGSYCA